MDKPVIVFFGTPDFAVPSLEILHKNEYPIAAVVTSPDKPAGRGQKISTSAIKDYAVANGIKVLQPVNLKDEKFIDELKSLNADLQIVVAFRMLPESVWSMPPRGTFNLHASLLPYYRGAAPINWAIMNGEKETGVTTFFLEHQIDTGKIIFRESTMIGKHENAGELHERLKELGAPVVLKTVQAIQKGNIHTLDQNVMSEGKEIPIAPKLTKENTRINIKMRPDQVANFILGLSPHPGAHTQLNNQSGISFSLKIFDAIAHKESHPHPAGKIVTDNKSFLNIYLPGGYISVEELQLSGKNRVKIKDFLNGLKIEGDWFIE
jgi:methionyl-tRNA formyltransferase